MADIHYDAFISYRHNPVDTAVAKELQHSLEHFRIPKSIQKSSGKGRISRIFRDQEELEITSDLSKKIDDALEASDFLIVVCSPRYCQSQWCLHEVETFVSKKGLDHVLCVISEGEPPEIFPGVLLKKEETLILEDGTSETRIMDTEPLACDYRGNFRQARRIELPRLVSVMLGCGYDELVLRQERYRRRRLSAILTGVFLLAAIAISYLLWSNAQISRNYRQSLINESKILAGESLSAMNEQDRLAALRYSLEAVGYGKENRPIVDEAVYSLSRSTYAYALPLNYLEDWRIDTVNDIISFCLSRDGDVMVVLDRLGTYHGISMDSHEELFSYDAGLSSTPSSPQTGSRGDFLFTCDGYAKSLDIHDGSERWSTPMKYMTINTLSVSPDGNYIAVADSYALQLMTSDGTPVGSIRLPDEYEGYITDLFWSGDGEEIGVYLKSHLEPQIGVFNVSSSGFSVITPVYSEVDFAAFGNDGNLYAVCSNSYYSSSITSDKITSRQNTYDLYCADNGQVKWHSEVVTNSPVSCVQTDIRPSEEPEVLLTLGSDIFRFSPDGMMLGSCSVNEVISAVVDVTEEGMEVITTSGKFGNVYLDDNSAFLNHTFPSGIEKILHVKKGSPDSFYVFLKDGNLSVYSDLTDDSARQFDGDGFFYDPLSSLRYGNYLLIYADEDFRFYDTASGDLIRKVSLDDGGAYHLLTALNGTAYVLRVDLDSAGISVCSYDMSTGDRIDKTQLPATEYYTSLGIFNDVGPSYLTFSFIDTLYLQPSPVAVLDSMLCIHDWNDPNSVTVYDLESGSMRTVHAVLESDCYLATARETLELSPLLISEDKSRLFSVMTNVSTGETHPVLISVGDGSVLILDNDIQDLNSPVFSDGTLMYSGSDSLFIYTQNGEFLTDIPFTGENAISFFSHDGRQLCVFPDGIMIIYENGVPMRRIRLSADISGYINGKAFRYLFNGDRLYLFCDHDLDVISLSSDGTTPIYSVTKNVIDADPDSREILCYGLTDPEKDVYSYIRAFHEYSVEELISRSKEQLEHFSLLPVTGE